MANQAGAKFPPTDPASAADPARMAEFARLAQNFTSTFGEVKLFIYSMNKVSVVS